MFISHCQENARAASAAALASNPLHSLMEGGVSTDEEKSPLEREKDRIVVGYGRSVSDRIAGLEGTVGPGQGSVGGGGVTVVQLSIGCDGLRYEGVL